MENSEYGFSSRDRHERLEEANVRPGPANKHPKDPITLKRKGQKKLWVDQKIKVDNGLVPKKRYKAL